MSVHSHLLPLLIVESEQMTNVSALVPYVVLTDAGWGVVETVLLYPEVQIGAVFCSKLHLSFELFLRYPCVFTVASIEYIRGKYKTKMADSHLALLFY